MEDNRLYRIIVDIRDLNRRHHFLKALHGIDTKSPERFHFVIASYVRTTRLEMYHIAIRTGCRRGGHTTFRARLSQLHRIGHSESQGDQQLLLEIHQRLSSLANRAQQADADVDADTRAHRTNIILLALTRTFLQTRLALVYDALTVIRHALWKAQSSNQGIFHKTFRRAQFYNGKSDHRFLKITRYSIQEIIRVFSVYRSATAPLSHLRTAVS